MTSRWLMGIHLSNDLYSTASPRHMSYCGMKPVEHSRVLLRGAPERGGRDFFNRPDARMRKSLLPVGSCRAVEVRPHPKLGCPSSRKVAGPILFFIRPMSLIAVAFKNPLDYLLPVSTTFSLRSKSEKVVINYGSVKTCGNLEHAGFTCCAILVRPRTVIGEWQTTQLADSTHETPPTQSQPY